MNPSDHLQIKENLNPNGKITKVFFIPAFLEDNLIGVARDPEYESRLMQRDPEVAQALRYGDWSVFTGMAFKDWSREIHVIQPFEIPWKFAIQTGADPIMTLFENT